MKTCTKCNIEKDLSEFPNAGVKEYPNRLRGDCRECVLKRHVTKEQREERNRKQKAYYQIPEVKARTIAGRNLIRLQNPIKYMLINAKSRAKRDGIPFEQDCIGLEMITHCPILGMPLKVNQGGTYGPAYDSPSLDKYKPELGYVKGNVSIVSNKANIMKSNATFEEVEKLYLWMKQQEN